MRASWTAITVAAALGLSAVAAGSANAAVTFKFTGDCADCSGAGGTLTLQNMPNGAISKADFVSFVYQSSLVSFQINSGDIVAVMGSIDPDNLGASYIDIIQLGGTGWEFERNADGTWSVYSDITGGQSHAASASGAGGGAGGGGGGGGSPGGSGGSGGSGGLGDGGGFGFSTGDTVDGFVIQQQTNYDTGGSSSFAAGVPEASTWALMLTGFAGMGAMLRNRRRSLRGIETA